MAGANPPPTFINDEKGDISHAVSVQKTTENQNQIAVFFGQKMRGKNENRQPGLKHEDFSQC